MTQSDQFTKTDGNPENHRLNVLTTETERAHYLLDLPDDWDSDGSPGFGIDTWHRTVRLAHELCGRLAEGWSLVPRDIEIMPGANGNLSLEVAYPSTTLLFSIPPDPDDSIRYYGRSDAAERTTKGLLAPNESLDWLSLWTATK